MTVQAGNAIEGFDVSLSSGDMVVTAGIINGVHVDGDTLDFNGIADGVAYAVTTEAGAALAAVAVPTGTQVAVASCTVATNAATLPVFTGRGETETVTLDA